MILPTRFRLLSSIVYQIPTMSFSFGLSLRLSIPRHTIRFTKYTPTLWRLDLYLYTYLHPAGVFGLAYYRLNIASNRLQPPQSISFLLSIPHHQIQLSNIHNSLLRLTAPSYASSSSSILNPVNRFSTLLTLRHSIPAVSSLWSDQCASYQGEIGAERKRETSKRVWCKEGA